MVLYSNLVVIRLRLLSHVNATVHTRILHKQRTRGKKKIYVLEEERVTN